MTKEAVKNTLRKLGAKHGHETTHGLGEIRQETEGKPPLLELKTALKELAACGQVKVTKLHGYDRYNLIHEPVRPHEEHTVEEMAEA